MLNIDFCARDCDSTVGLDSSGNELAIDSCVVVIQSLNAAIDSSGNFIGGLSGVSQSISLCNSVSSLTLNSSSSAVSVIGVCSNRAGDGSDKAIGLNDF